MKAVSDPVARYLEYDLRVMLGRKKCRVARFAAIVSLSGLLAGCAEPETSTVMQDAAMCGGIAGNACPAGRTCDLPAGMCNAAKGLRRCKALTGCKAGLRR